MKLNQAYELIQSVSKDLSITLKVSKAGHAKRSTCCAPAHSIIFLSTDVCSRLVDSHGVTAEEALMITFAHEVGHIVAYRDGLDQSCELTAWDIAEDIYSVMLNQNLNTKAWTLIRNHALRSYGLVA